MVVLHCLGQIRSECVLKVFFSVFTPVLMCDQALSNCNLITHKKKTHISVPGVKTKGFLYFCINWSRIFFVIWPRLMKQQISITLLIALVQIAQIFLPVESGLIMKLSNFSTLWSITAFFFLNTSLCNSSCYKVVIPELKQKALSLISCSEATDDFTNRLRAF